MILYPAIDLAGGKCVRLIQGVRKDETVYHQNPEDVARQWEGQGAEFLHVVDLDGAFEGVSQNLLAVRKIVSAVRIPIQLGGGIRTLSDMQTILNIGVRRVILGTAAAQNPDLAAEALGRFGEESIALGVDVRDGKVAVKGWTEKTALTAIDFGQTMKKAGLKTFIFTDIHRDGMLTGPNLGSLSEFSQAVGGGVIASGGVTSLADVRDIAAMAAKGVTGMIIGKSLYENRISLPEALKIANGKS